MNTLAQHYQLRDYQQELLQKIFVQWGAGDRRLLVGLPTGAGKTVLFSTISQHFVRRGEGVLVIAHREELLLQAKEKLEAVIGQPAGLIKAGYPLNPEHPIQIASVQTLTRRDNWPDAGLVVVDEAHHSCADSYVRIFEHYSTAYILGVTATPGRSDGQGFNHLYDCLVLGQSVQELIQAGYLCQFRLFGAPKIIKTDGLKLTGGDFNPRELAEAVDASLVVGDLIKSYRKFAPNKKAVVFAVDVAHSKEVANAYCKAGIPSEHLDGETPPNERKAILERFGTGKTLVLTNCGIVSEGVDIPSIEAIQCVRPTKSLILWLQMIGRALRPTPGKDHAIIIDHTQNWFFQGLPDEEREWTLDPVSMTHQSLALECSECGHIFRPLPHEKVNAVCPNCGVVVRIDESDTDEESLNTRVLITDESVELEEIGLELNSEIITEMLKLKAMQMTRKYKPVWVFHEIVKAYPDIGLGELRECAKLLGYKRGWAWHRWHELRQSCG